MVFFTCVIVVVVLYFLQRDGLIFVTIIAVIAELINLFMAQTLTKSVAKQTSKKFIKIINGYKAKIAAQKKTIKEFQDLQDESIKKLHHANLKIKEYEKILKKENHSETINSKEEKSDKSSDKSEERQKPEKIDMAEDKVSQPEEFVDLPSGSNRRKLPD